MWVLELLWICWKIQKNSAILFTKKILQQKYVTMYKMSCTSTFYVYLMVAGARLEVAVLVWPCDT
jgi:hypothetical protein